MSRVQFAEWFLRLVTSREQAASIVGDFTEQTAARGAAWFWSRVLRTTASITWRGIAEDPIHMTGVAFTGFIVCLVAITLLGGMLGVALLLVGFHPKQIDYESMGWIIAVNALYLIISLWIGRKLACWAPDRELAACLTYAIVNWTLVVLCSVLLMPILVPSEHLRLSDAIWILFNVVVQCIPVLIGAVWGRNRRLAAH